MPKNIPFLNLISQYFMLYRRLLFLLILVFFLAEGKAQDGLVKQYEIAAIKVDGTKNLDRAVLISLSGLRVGQTITVPGEEIPNAIKALWNQSLFAHVEINAARFEGSKIFLRIRVEEKARISRYTIRGVRNGEIEDLRKKIELRSGVVLTNHLRASIIRTIKNYFIDKGFIYPNVNIVESQDSLLPGSNLVIIKIDKGSKYKVDRIQFEGNNNITTRPLKKSMKNTKELAKFNIGELVQFKKNLKDPSTTAYQKLGKISILGAYEYASEFINPNIFVGAKFDKNKFEEDKKSIEAYYNSLGYRDARVTWDTVYSYKPQKLLVRIKIDEGHPYFFRNVRWIGNTKYPDSILTQVLNIKKGEIYNQKKLEEKLTMSQAGDDISALYMDDGYLFFNVIPSEELVGEDSIDLELRVYEGPQAIINKVNIYGNTKTNEKVIRRELRIRPGEKFDRSKLIRTQRELSALGYFDPQQMQINPRPNPENGTVDIDLRVAEKPSDQLELSLGYGGAQFGLYGTVGVNFTNFSVKNIFNPKAWSPLPTGDGENLNLRIQANGRQSQMYSVSFTEPWLGGKKPNSLQVSFNRQRFNNVAADTISGSYYRTSGTVELGTRLKWPDDYFTLFGAISYDNTLLSNYSGVFNFKDGSVNNIFARITLGRNSLSGPVGPQIYPTTGSNIQFSVQATLPYSLIFPSRQDIPMDNLTERYKFIEYHKWKFSIDWYTPLIGNLVFRANAKFGALGSYSSKFGLSPFERFELGGDGIQFFSLYGKEIYGLRGYETSNIMSSVDPNGATIFNKYIFELRYPVSLNPSATIYGIVFGEAGNAWSNIREFKPFDLKRSFGVGVRFFLPMFGLLGFDYGIGFDKKITGTAANDPFIDKYGKFRFILGFEPQ